MNVSVYKDALLKKRIELEETAGLKPLSDSMSRWSWGASCSARS